MADKMSRNTVYKVRQGGNHFAVKQYQGDQSALRVCLHEATLLHRMRHRHIAELAGLFEDGRMFYLVMPFYEYIGPI